MSDAFLVDENKKLNAELATIKIELYQSKSESSLLLETIHTQHHTL